MRTTLLLGRTFGVFAACMCAGCGLRRQESRAQTFVAPVPISVDNRPIADPGFIARAAARVAPSVVTIDTEYRPPRSYGYEEIFGFNAPPRDVPRGAGSGVIISPDGVIVTNNHVIRNATRISVTLQNGHELIGKVVGADSQTDLAVVKVNEKNLPAIVLADSDQVKVGEWVVAAGNPLGIGLTVTAGIVSAIRTGKTTSLSGTSLASVIQTDAAINPGNSGGALADIQGRLIGINTAIASTNGGSIGIGFAIPANTVRDVVKQLLSEGRIVRPWLGVTFGPLTERARDVLKVPSHLEGVVIGDVLPGSPASEAGLQSGDVVLQANDQTLKTAEDLQNLMRTLKVGDRLRLRIWRDGAERGFNATLQERPADLLNR